MQRKQQSLEQCGHRWALRSFSMQMKHLNTSDRDSTVESSLRGGTDDDEGEVAGNEDGSNSPNRDDTL